MKYFLSILVLFMCQTWGATPTGAIPPRVNSNPVTQEYDVTWWGASTNSLDNSSALNAAVTYVSGVGGGVVRIPTGTLKIASRIDLADGVLIRGSGIGVTTLVFTNMGIPTQGFMFGTGSTNNLPVQASNISAGSQIVTFASNPSLVAGDVYFVMNTSTSSFSLWRPVYYQGEAFKVFSTSGNTVTNTSLAFASYTGTTNSFYKMVPIRTGVSDLSVIFPPGVSAPGIKVSLGNRPIFKNLELRGSRINHLDIDRCYDSVIDNVRCYDNEASVGENYGLKIDNSQNVYITRYDASTMRHSFATGGNDVQPAIPVRSMFVSDSILGSSALVSGTPGCNTHGNIEYAYWNNCAFYAGFEAGGDHQYFDGCTFFNGEAAGRAFVTSETVGWDFLLSNCKFKGVRTFDGGMISLANRDHIQRPGEIFKIQGGSIDGQGFGSSTYPTDPAPLINIFGLFGTAPDTEDTPVQITGVSFKNSLGAGPSYGIRVFTPATNGLTRLTIKDNIFEKCGITIVPNIDEVFIEGNQINSAPEFAIATTSISPSHTGSKWQVNGNRIRNTQKYGATITLDSTATIWFCGNTSINAGQVGAGWSSFVITGPGVCFLYGNFYGDNQTVATQSAGASVISCARLFRGFNQDIGMDIHPFPMTVSSITDELGWSPSRTVMWNFKPGYPTSTTHTNQIGDITWNTTPTTAALSSMGTMTTVAGAPGTQVPLPPVSTVGYIWWDTNNLAFVSGGSASGGYNFPFNWDRQTNASVQYLLQNKIASGNTSASAAVTVQGGANGNSGSILLSAYPADYSTVALRASGGIQSRSDDAFTFIYNSSANQPIKFMSGGTTVGAQLDGQVWKMPGGAMFHRNAQAGTYAILTNDVFIASTGTSTKTLPAANTIFAGQIFVIMSGNTFTTTVARTGSDTINGAAADDSLTSNVSARYMSDGTSNYQKF